MIVTSNSLKKIEARQNELTKVILDNLGIPDGIPDMNTYFGSHPKIMWVLKEVNDTSGEPWSYLDALFNNHLKTTHGLKPGWEKTFSSIVYASYGILKNKSWTDIPDIKEKPDIIDVLKNIALINIKKQPGGAVANRKELERAGIANKHILSEQIQLANPDIIIFGNTFDLFPLSLDELLGAGDWERVVISEFTQLFKTRKRLLLDVYHPTCMGKKGLNMNTYCSEIIGAARTWRQP